MGKHDADPTWESNDGPKMPGKRMAMGPAARGDIVPQPVKANDVLFKPAL
jgi:hypothetical protein